MNPPLGRFSEPVYALLRIVAGALFTFHGAQKLFGAFGGHAQPIASLMGAAGIIETVCGLLIMIGLFGSVAAFIASGEMAVAYFMAHQPKAPWPIQNQGELAVLYCFLFLYIAARGSGAYSVDGALHPSRDRWVGRTTERKTGFSGARL
jgi:putative oxidoreductase